MIISWHFIVNSFFIIIFNLVPNVTWYTNIFLIINEFCILIMFFTAILFAFLDKLCILFITFIF